MRHVPVVPQHVPQPSAAMLKKVERLAAQLVREDPMLAPPPTLRDLIPDSLESGGAIHIDDFSELDQLGAGSDISFYQCRSRLRAGDGDVIVAHCPGIDDYEQYCRTELQLGNVTWLCPQDDQGVTRPAEAAWTDRLVRRELVQRIRSGVIRFLHPHMGTQPVWELAGLLQQSANRPLQVIAPFPGLCRWVNDKVAFAETVTRLFGESASPVSESAWNETQLIPRLRRIAEHCQFVGVKLPHSAGGDGNFVFDSAQILSLSTPQLKQLLRSRLPSERDFDMPMLIDAWQTDVLCSPSVQTWIPPRNDGPPVIEGIFVQETRGIQGTFVGNEPASFPHTLTEEIAERAWLLALLYQHLGYVGRCSVDLILVGESAGSCHIEFIECNGRWGGTSLPMTLMNRLFGNFRNQPYLSRVAEADRLDRVSFAELRAALQHRLFRADERTGDVVLYNPLRMQAESAVDVITFGQTREQADSGMKSVADQLAGIAVSGCSGE